MQGEAWESLTEAQKIEAVRLRRATLEQMRQGVLDGPDQLRKACWEALTHSAKPQLTPRREHATQENRQKQVPTVAVEAAPKTSRSSHFPRQRFGLPEGFVPRQQRGDGNLLLPNNIYRLPNSLEVIPAYPSGTLGRLRHIYALLTVEQHRLGLKGSIYVRHDGRIFDYSVDDVASGREMFDTGFTVHDLERTGSYAEVPKPVAATARKKHAQQSTS